MSDRELIHGWLILVVLSLCTTAAAILSAAGQSRLLIGGVVLALAGFKARVIFGRYLGLARSRVWRRGSDGVLVVFLTLAFCVYAFGTKG